MIQAIGLTSNPRKDLPPVVDDVSFEAHAGRVTALLGTPGAGKTTALRLMLELQQGRGITYFRGRPLHRIAHPSREVGVLLGDVPGHPARTVRGQLRMLCAAAGVPVRRADEVLEVVGLVSLRDERLSTLSRGMDRRLGLACALLADPHTLVLDAPADGLSAREGRWLHGLLRAHATQGGTVLFTTDDPREAAQTADQVVTLEAGRLVADQEAADFARTRLRPRVAVRSPHAARLGALLAKEARTGQRSVEIVREDGNRLSVYGSTCADVGETAFRHGILVHQLADETGDMGAAPDTQPTAPPPRPAGSLESEDLSPLPPPISVRQAPSPLRPLRYELRRAAGVGTGYVTAAAVLIASALIAVILARIGHTPQHRLLAAWPQDFPLPPAALGAGLLGAVAFGDEFRHPALATDRGTVPRRLGLLTAKLLVSGATALLLAFLAVGCDLEVLYLVYGRELTQVPTDWLSLGAGWLGLLVGCAWAGVLAAGIFRSTTAGLAAVLAVPVVVVPLVQRALEGPSVRTAAGFATRLRELMLVQWPFGGERYLAAAARVVAQPVGSALMLSLTALLCAYLLTTLRSRVR
ncbi:ABC transporter [Streptomyces avermitilis]|uniref:ABC transporter ATP-binding protein n=1 Tax=Streptomyces avermitilis (strain ATCC 31267 / DSM 46492 / JCM 5070 / NBRC 14893 / NCIMB 12804 / NRRL 8165 / MA-4680) TaxID=227882 RepID=Q82KF7_STRAW|nr:ATP-binding cassette domain-containing protein [Streptomyces avermitilis]KUN50533.1 ABC transporter [Streptomyces avermitilis]MYS98052.1 ATP-binding cassette domain-containing protein [Streptomyces sp. SID5469]OOV33520.1 ABC transporter [Streptomyces avermitilis]BAC70157.1 putative ABC transporter ATP-binding protein [Streptomyces avermitilis MA-4680 = NBRC 14893]